MFPPSRRSRFHTRGPTRNTGAHEAPSLPRLLLVAAIVLLATFVLASLVKRDPAVSVSGASARCESFGEGGVACSAAGGSMRPGNAQK
jgi:hypothetical protein